MINVYPNQHISVVCHLEFPCDFIKRQQNNVHFKVRITQSSIFPFRQNPLQQPLLGLIPFEQPILGIIPLEQSL